MWLAQLQLRYEIEERENDPDNPDVAEEYLVNEVDLEHGPEAMARWNAGRTEFLRCVEQAGGSLEEAMRLDREMRAILRAADQVAFDLNTGPVDEVSLEVFSAWQEVLDRFDRFEDQVALVLAVRQPPPDPPTPIARVREPQPPAIAEPRDSSEPEHPRLMRKAADLLEALLSLDAVSPSKQRTRTEVVRAVNRRHDVWNYARAFRQLAGLGYYHSATGPDGGVWLTPVGAQRAKKLRAATASR